MTYFHNKTTTEASPWIESLLILLHHHSLMLITIRMNKKIGLIEKKIWTDGNPMTRMRGEVGPGSPEQSKHLPQRLVNMKPKHWGVIIFYSALSTVAAQPYTYLTDGVDKENLDQSERFYDSGKGHYWTWGPGVSIVDGPRVFLGENTYKEYQKAGNNFSFLGELQGRVAVNGTTTYDSESTLHNSGWYSNLSDDSNTCWYQVSANLIQYWQSYYGVFAKDTEKLPYGFTYDRSSLNALGGTQSLEVGMVLYDNVINEAGNLRFATDYYFSGGDLSNTVVSYSYYRQNNTIAEVYSDNFSRAEGSTPSGGSASKGGYFSDYFTVLPEVDANINELSSITIMLVDEETNVTTNDATAGEAILTAMGCKISESGEIVRETVGQIAYVGLEGHALTCYGFELKEDKSIKSLQVTNSDDLEYKLFTVYVGDNGDLYTDEQCTTEWKYNQQAQSIRNFEYINTPDELKQMYQAYTAGNLEWNGLKTDATWSGDYESTTDELPTDKTGWHVYVDSQTKDEHDNYYNSYYAEDRVVEFGEHGKAQSDVTVEGAVQAAGMELSATDATEYRFSGDSATSDSINLSGDLVKTSTGTDELTNLKLLAQSVSIQAGELVVSNGAVVTAKSGTIENTGMLSLDTGSSTTINSLTVENGGSVAAGVDSTFTGNMTLSEGAELAFDVSGLSTYALLFDGQLTLTGAVDVNVIGLENVVSLTAGSATNGITLIHFDQTQTNLGKR